jgi:hypothetical protein
MDPKSSLSLLDEIKDIASKEAESERANKTQKVQEVTAEATPANSQTGPRKKNTGSRRASSLNLELSKALADVHDTVSRKAAEEERDRRQTQELAKQAAEAERRASEQQKATEVEARIKAEEARQRAADEERRIKLIKLEYEAALARGEQVEMPEELKPKPIPQEVLAQVNGPVEPVRVQVAPPEKKNPMVMWVSVAATVLVLALGGVMYKSHLDEQERLRQAEAARIAAEEKRRQEEEEAKRLALIEKQRLEREAREAKLKAELAAAIAAKEEAERKREEEERSRKRTRRGGKRSGRKKPKIKGINLSGF